MSRPLVTLGWKAEAKSSFSLQNGVASISLSRSWADRPFVRDMASVVSVGCDVRSLWEVGRGPECIQRSRHFEED